MLNAGKSDKSVKFSLITYYGVFINAFMSFVEYRVQKIVGFVFIIKRCWTFNTIQITYNFA